MAYNDKAKSKTTLEYDKHKESPGILEPKDVGRAAEPFDGALTSKMTPTMRSFTLEGKVAVVTGYVYAFAAEPQLLDAVV